MITRAREESGFGLVELLVAMLILNIGILALIAAFTSGTISIARASALSTASALADAQMEGYRAIRFDSIGLVGAPTSGTYATDPAYTDPSPKVTFASCPSGVPPAQCTASQTKLGADNRDYVVDTYIVSVTQGGRTLKKVTVVARGPAAPTGALVRAVSTFDASNG